MTTPLFKIGDRVTFTFQKEGEDPQQLTGRIRGIRWSEQAEMFRYWAYSDGQEYYVDESDIRKGA